MAINSENQQTEQELKSSLDFNHSRADKIAEFITKILGSMLFLIVCMLLFMTWICWNLNFFSFLKPFDPFPFPILEMGVSIFAIVLSVSVLINQNRQGKIEKIRSQVEFEVNVRAENEITKMLNMLHEIHQRLGLDSKKDEELEAMKEQIDIKQIHQALDEMESNNSTPDQP